MFVRTVGSTPDRSLQARRAFFGPLTRLLNPPIRRLAGRSGVPLLGLVSHQGRRSGRTYVTPVGVGSAGTAFLIPLTFGPTSDWCRNVLAAGGCTLTWRGVRYTADQAEIIDDRSARAEVKAAFGPLQQLAFRMLGLHQFLRLRRPDGQPAGRARSTSGPARVRAAGGRILHWRGSQYALVDPAIVAGPTRPVVGPGAVRRSW